MPQRIRRTSTSAFRCIPCVTASPPTCWEQKVDIRVIQVLLGHRKLDIITHYAQVAIDLLREVISPLEVLPPQ
jgi:hypothetical protein